MSYFNEYGDYLTRTGRSCLVHAIYTTSEEVVEANILRNYNWGSTNRTGLLLGHVQSGKTSHVLGLIARAADFGFNVFILLTSDIVGLQQQTFKRAFEGLKGFNVCDESDELKFIQLAHKSPSLLVLKKNANVLESWYKRLSASGLFPGNPVFIIDDEGDAASLNTQVNQNEVSKVNLTLAKIRRLSKADVYLQVTATPQALFLQTHSSNWKPNFVTTFKPGDGYLGGDFFFSESYVPNSVVITDDQEIDALLKDTLFSSTGLLEALLSYLITCSHLFSVDKAPVCNFVIHPGVRTLSHSRIAQKISAYLGYLTSSFQNTNVQSLFQKAYQNLKTTKSDLLDANIASREVQLLLHDNKFSIQLMNSQSKVTDYTTGANIIVGGNSLSRGITFPKLQTMYYCRTAKVPQADTVWQHCRMFGYDRNPSLVRAYLPAKLYKILTQLNSASNSIFEQASSIDPEKLRIYYPKNIKPTRRMVLDNNNLSIITGGVNYFPFDPVNHSIEALDSLLQGFSGQDFHTVSLNLIATCLNEISNCDPEEWSSSTFINCIKAFTSDHPGKQGILIVRRDRDIGKNTGTMLSPTDRELGMSFKDKIVLTLYKVQGNKGWNGQRLWVPNIKFPDGINFYDIRN